MTPDAATAASTVPLRRNRDFTLLTTGGTVSAIGNGMSGLAFLLLTYAVTRSTPMAGVVSAAWSVGYGATTLVAGALVDRWDRRRVMVAASVIGFLVMGSIPLAAVLWRITAVHLLLASFLSGVRAAFYSPAEVAAVKRIVPASQLGQAASVNMARQQLGALVGPPLAGLLFAVSRVLPMTVDALTFLVGAVCARLVRTDLSPVARPTRTRLVADMREGFAFLARSRPLLDTMVVALVVNFAVNGILTVAMLALQEAGTAPVQLGLVEAVTALAGLAGAVAAGWVVGRVRVGTVTLAALAVAATMATAMPVRNTWWWVAATIACVALVGGPLNTGLFAYEQAITPDALQGRVSSATGFVSMCAAPVATASAGFLLHGLGRVPTMLGFAAVAVAALVLALVSPYVRAIPKAGEFVPA